MRTIPYSTILQQATQLAFGQESAGAEDAATLQVFINARASEAWADYWWPELCLVEQREFRQTWETGVTYAAGTEVYHVESDTYYQALRSAFDQAPATLSGDVWTTNADYWHECQASYDSEDWETGLVIAKGDLIRNPANDTVYACHTAHTAGGSFDATKFGAVQAFIRSLSLTQTGENAMDSIKAIHEQDPRLEPGQQPIPFTLYDDPVVHTDLNRVWVHFRKRVPTWIGTVWVAQSYSAGAVVFYGADWYEAIASATSANLPTDTTKWRKLDFPYVFRTAIPMAAYGDWLVAEGQLEKSRPIAAAAAKMLEREHERIALAQAQLQPRKVRSYQ